MRDRRLCLATILMAALSAGALPAPGLAQEAAAASQIQSPILTIDRDRLYAETMYGKAVEARFKADSDALIAENLRLEQALETEERDLTDRRNTLPAAEFKALAAAFDAKAESIRTAQQAKSRAIGKKREGEQQRFLEAAIPVIGSLMRESGAAAVFDKQMIIVSLRAVDITDAAVARVDAVLGSGEDGAAQSPAPTVTPTATPSPAPSPSPQP
ncbi:OmpH family outer membrane protein [Paragemmobacter straminiformis]|uniref:OmpH family outer membrane protein n=1 Tax=Paragemmobacter straminiformis TaxID=2045119 RepID=A0A842I7F5_9RHOB|nr:OmpH family outer membrane protein [Gemmobacter straminiformis]MBC2835307.1 OmpH family outer membrane protein [Gemmobacter straminiformis]